MRHRLIAAACLLLAAAAPLPKVTDDQAPPVEHPYDTQADAHAAVQTAFAQAKATGRNVMLDFGGNWCPDCRVLAGVLQAPVVKPWVDQNFVTVLVDVGRFKKNLDIAAQYGVKINAAPTVLVISPDGRVLNQGNVFALADARSMSAQAVVNLLAGWEKS
jgi:thiol-disulfide isomerase/thioredoxin